MTLTSLRRESLRDAPKAFSNKSGGYLESLRAERGFRKFKSDSNRRDAHSRDFAK